MSVSLPLIPPMATQSFANGISHSELWLWDSWCYSEDKTLHLYALALSRHAADGSNIHPENRNDYPFHIRHFESNNEGKTWSDLGSILTPSTETASYYGRNIWSGSAVKLSDTRKLMGFTGLRNVDADHLFLQNIGIAISNDGSAFDKIQAEPISCPRRDFDTIIKAGYYLGPRESLGHKDGEDGGPILAWRDPYIFIDDDGIIHCFWSAKTAPKTGAIAHATLIETKSGFEIDTLYPPIELPDGNNITQAEVPKVYYDKHRAIYYCLISACDRLYEGQDDSEVSKTLRLYKASSLRGPWTTYREGSSILPNMTNIFGASIFETNYQTGKFKFLAPITEQAAPALQLTFAPVQTLNIYDLENEEAENIKPSHHKIA